MTQEEKIFNGERDPHVPDHTIDWAPSPRWIRVIFGGKTIADSKHVMLLRETNHLPVYYFPINDVRMDLLTRTDHTTHCPYKGDAIYWTVKAGDNVVENAVWSYPNPIPERQYLKEYLAFYWDKMDAWYEEAEEVFVHPRDPYKRIDTLPSRRHVRVVVAGETIAETDHPHLLFETHLPTRYYIPQEDVRLDLLESSDSHSRCPYKGVASFWSVKVGERVFKDLVWSYLDPIPESPKIKGLFCFYNEKVDLYVDGELQPRPKTPWS